MTIHTFPLLSLMPAILPTQDYETCGDESHVENPRLLEDAVEGRNAVVLVLQEGNGPRRRMADDGSEWHIRSANSSWCEVPLCHRAELTQASIIHVEIHASATGNGHGCAVDESFKPSTLYSCTAVPR